MRVCVCAAYAELVALLGADNVTNEASELEDYGSDKYSFHSGPRSAPCCVCVCLSLSVCV